MAELWADRGRVGKWFWRWRGAEAITEAADSIDNGRQSSGAQIPQVKDSLPTNIDAADALHLVMLAL